MTYQQIIASQNFTELEIKVLDACNQNLKMFYGEDFSDIDVSDIAKTSQLEMSTVKGVVGSLVKKRVLKTESQKVGNGRTVEFIYFTDQENM